MEPTSLDPQDRFAHIKIPRSEAANFPDEWRELLLLAFPKANPITVLGPLSGYSDERVWSVATQVGPDTQLFVVKIGLRKRIEREYEKSEKVIGGGLYGNPVTPGKKIDHPTDLRWSLMPSTLAGSDKADTLLTHLTHGDASDMEDILKKIFTNQNKWRENMRVEPMRYEDYYDRLLPEHIRVAGIDGNINNAIPIDAISLFRNPPDVYKLLENKGIIELRNFYLEKQEETVLTLSPQRLTHAGTFLPRVKYDLVAGQSFPASDDKPMIALFGQNPRTRYDLLHEYAQGALSGMSKNRNTKFFALRRAGLKFPDPIEFLPQLLSFTANLRFALNHGDLNLQNILIASEKKNKSDSSSSNIATGNAAEEKRAVDSVWLIDFADVDRGPALLDFQWLEVQVIIRLLTPAADEIQLSVHKLIELFKYLHDCDIDAADQLDARLRKPYHILRQLRRFAKEHLLNDWSEYYHGLVICLLGSLRFKRLIEKGQLSKSAPRIAFLSAATLLCWADILSDDDKKKISDLLHTPDLAKSSPPPQPPPTAAPGEKKPGAPKAVPMVDKGSIPAKIFVQQPFFVKGKAQPKAKVQVIAEGPPVTILADEGGHWETKIILKRVGANTLSVWDDTHKLKSDEVLLTALEEPTIDKNSMPAKILQGEKFTLRGKGHPSATIHLYTNRQEQPLAATTATVTGSWQMDVTIVDAGDHELLAWDKSNDVQSAPIAMLLVNPATKKNKWRLLTTGLVAALLLAVAFLNFAYPDETATTVEAVQEHIAGMFSKSTPVPTPLLTPVLPATSTPTVEPTITAWNTTPEAACAAIKAWKLTVSASEDSGPYSYVKNGKITGFDIDLLRKALENCTSFGVSLDGQVDDYLVFRQIPVKDRKLELDSGGVQLVIGSVADKGERCSGAYSCTKEYAIDEQAIAVLADTETGYCVPTLSTVVVISGTTGDSTFAEYLETCRTHDSAFSIEKKALPIDREEALNMVIRGEAIAYKANKDLLQYKIAGDITFSTLKIIPGGPAEPLVMWLKRENAGLRALINAMIEKLEEDVTSIQDLCEHEFEGYDKDCTQFPIRRAPNTLSLGIALAGSGDQRALARDQRVGLTVALDDTNPRLKEQALIQFVVEPRNNITDSQSAIIAFNDLVTEDVVAIIGPTYSYQLFAVFADSQIITSSIPVISTSATADEAAMLGANNFRTSLGVKVYAGSAIDAAIRESKIAQHAIRSVVLASKANDKFTESEVRAFATGLSGYSDLTVTPPITYTTDYSGVVSTVLARKPDLFILSGLIDDGGKILELLTKTTYTGTIIIGNGLNTTEVFQYCGLKCDGIYIAQAYNHAWPNPGNQRFQAAYKRYFDLHYQEDPLLPQQPSQIMAQMYTAVQTIAEALLAIDKDYEKNGKAPLRYVNLSDNGQLQTLRKALIEKLLTTEEDTPESKITFDTPLDKQTWFDKEGDIQQNSYCVARIKMNSANEGEFVILNPTEYGLNCNKPE